MPTAYLTVDDAPSPDFGAKVDALAARGVPALFFCEGRSLDERRDAAVDAVERGYHLGNHGWSHTRCSELSVDEVRAEVERTDAVIDAVYDRSSVQRPIDAFRFPFGDPGRPADRAAIQSVLADLGYEPPALPDVTYDWWTRGRHAAANDWFWTVDVEEYVPDTVDGAVARVREQRTDHLRRLTALDAADVVLLHDHPETTDRFAPVLDALLDHGVSFADPVAARSG